MTESHRNIAVLGSTGSIGCSTLEVIAGCSDKLRVVGLTGHTQVERLQQQAQEFQCPHVVITDESRADLFDTSVLPSDGELSIGQSGVEQLVSRADVDVVVAAMVGSAGLRGTCSQRHRPTAVA